MTWFKKSKMEKLGELDKEKLLRLEALWKEARDEVRQRISQRDSFFIRMYISFAAILVATIKNDLVLIFLPFVALYFSILISHSYQIHEALASYMRNDLEVKIKALLYAAKETPHVEYEEMFEKKKLVSVRAWLYDGVTYFISATTVLLAWLLCSSFENLLAITLCSLLCCIAWFMFKTFKLRTSS